MNWRYQVQTALRSGAMRALRLRTRGELEAFLWLLRRGSWPEGEPRRVVSDARARVPDFLAHGRLSAWVECKDLQETADELVQVQAWEDLRARVARLPGNYAVYSLVGDRFEHRAAKVAIGHLKRAIARGTAPSSETVVVVAQNWSERQWYRFSYVAENGRVVNQAGPRTNDDQYPILPTLEPMDWMHACAIETNDGVLPQRAICRVIEPNGGIQLAFRLFEDDKPTHLRSLGHPEARLVSTANRIRRVVDDAAEQLASAQRYRPIPGVVQVSDFSWSAVDFRGLCAALFGDLMVPISLDGECAEPLLGPNGVLRPTTNTAVSAVRYVSSKRTFLVVNPWALFPVEPRRLGTSAYILSDDGAIVPWAE